MLQELIYYADGLPPSAVVAAHVAGAFDLARAFGEYVYFLRTKREQFKKIGWTESHFPETVTVDQVRSTACQKTLRSTAQECQEVLRQPEPKKRPREANSACCSNFWVLDSRLGNVAIAAPSSQRTMQTGVWTRSPVMIENLMLDRVLHDKTSRSQVSSTDSKNDMDLRIDSIGRYRAVMTCLYAPST